MIEALKQALADAQRRERHRTVAETRYWCEQYRLLAKQAITEAEKQEPVAMRYDFDGYGWSYIDNGSGSNWMSRIKDAEPVYTSPPQRQPLTEWQQIETAPKDGTAVLVMRDIWPGTETGRAEECNGHNTYVAEWWSGEGDGGEWICYMDMVKDPICPIEPTHWMPLPAPPIKADHGIKGEA